MSHQQKVLDAVHAGARTSYDVAQWTRLSRDTASAHLSALKAAGLIRRCGLTRIAGSKQESYVWELVPGARAQKIGRPGRPPAGSECWRCKTRWRQEKNGLCRKCDGEDLDARTKPIETAEARPVVVAPVEPPVKKAAMIRSAKDELTGRVVEYEVLWDGTDNTEWGRDLHHEWPQRRSQGKG